MGTLRDIRREGKQNKGALKQQELRSRLVELVQSHGRKWTEIAQALEDEGYLEHGKPVSANALRKRYKRWVESGDISIPDEESSQKERRLPSAAPKERRGREKLEDLEGDRLSPSPPTEDRRLQEEMLRVLKETRDEMVEIKERFDSREEYVRRRREHDRRRALASTEKDDERFSVEELMAMFTPTKEEKLSQIGITRTGEGNTVSMKDVLQQIREPIQETVEEMVDQELKSMLQGESVKSLIERGIEAKLKDYMEGITVKEVHKGPGRGKRGRTHKKFSASLPQDLYDEVKGLPGLFSGHLSAALSLYLKIAKEKSSTD